MRIYTKTGDEGKTSLLAGGRVDKSDLRVCAYGDVDEVSSILGLFAARIREASAELALEVEAIQGHLVDVGAVLASAGPPGTAGISHQAIRDLETAIDRMEAGLPALTGFVLPGGHESAAVAHMARCVCRRAERQAVALYAGQDITESEKNLLRYINRLSDYLFVAARRANQLFGRTDTFR